MIKNRVNVLMGAQAGSESKGKLAAYLVDKFEPALLAMTASPNAGHVVVKDGVRYVTYHLPAAMVGAKGKYIPTVVLGPASVINVDILMKEKAKLNEAGVHFDLLIDSRSVIITPAMVKEELGSLTKIGSTAQGVGKARIARINRIDVMRATDVEELSAYVTDTVSFLHSAMDGTRTCLFESTQGFDLCLDHGIDPVYCTTRNITVAGALAEIGMPPAMLGHVYGVLRPYPIRVNNRDGWSGPYTGAEEIDWETVRTRSGCPYDLTEMTTTTKLKRRVFEFSWYRFHRFCEVNRPDFLALQFANYLDHSCYDETRMEKMPFKVLNLVEKLDQLAPVAYLGTGPEHAAMVDRGIDRGELRYRDVAPPPETKTRGNNGTEI